MSQMKKVSFISVEKHTHLTDVRMAKDFEDMQKIDQFFREHNSFAPTLSKIRNILMEL